jgi:hypothetical protein
MGKGGGEAPSQVSTITIPEYAQPYMEKLLGQTEALTETPLASYTGERIAGPTVAQREARLAFKVCNSPGLLPKQSQQLYRSGWLRGSLLRSVYSPTQFSAQNDVQALNFNVMECRPLRPAFDPIFSSIR